MSLGQPPANPSRRRIPANPRFARRARVAAAGIALMTAGGAPPILAQEAGDAVACQRAGLEAEHKADLPAGLLRAIGLVESGRIDPASGRVAAWPWTINAGGTGQAFKSLPEALAETRTLQGRGVASVDVGCFQINLLHHPTAFASLEEAFDPSANAAYAARFLLALRTRTGSWDGAIAAYHSATPERGSAYHDHVLASLKSLGETLVEATAPASRVVVWMPSAAGDPMRIWRPSAPGAAPGMIVIRRAPDL